jgi:hypothetical protein
MEHFGQHQGSWISYGTLECFKADPSTLRLTKVLFGYNQLDYWVSLNVLGSAMEHLGQLQGF